MATDDEATHPPSTDAEDGADGPERRIERRWRPAPRARPHRSGDEGEEAAPPPGVEREKAPPPPGDGGGAGAPPAVPSGPPGPLDVPSPTDGENTDPGPDPSAASEDEASTDAGEPTSAPDADTDREEVRDRGKRINEEALTDASDDRSWAESGAPEQPQTPDDDTPDLDKEFFTDETRRAGPADQVEEAIQDVAYRINDGTASTDWTPTQRRDRQIATTFALLVSKVAEDMSYDRRPGDEFWDPRKIMRRQIDNRPLRHCKMEYTKRRLALLVDTSPSCRDEAVFYSKIASGAMLRDDIDIFLCPNGHIEAKFDPEPMRFVCDDRGADWGLEGRTVLYFTDWDGSDELVAHSRDCNLYWFDNCPPEKYWESRTERSRRTRLRYRGRHFHCPDPEAFRTLVRKIRP